MPSLLNCFKLVYEPLASCVEQLDLTRLVRKESNTPKLKSSQELTFLIYIYKLCLFRIPGAGSYPNIESRESPVGGSCNYVNETSGGTANAAVAAAVAAAGQATVSTEPKLIYKKSVFKKKSTSSTATVSTTKQDRWNVKKYGGDNLIQGV